MALECYGAGCTCQRRPPPATANPTPLSLSLSSTALCACCGGVLPASPDNDPSHPCVSPPPAGLSIGPPSSRVAGWPLDRRPLHSTLLQSSDLWPGRPRCGLGSIPRIDALDAPRSGPRPPRSIGSLPSVDDAHQGGPSSWRPASMGCACRPIRSSFRGGAMSHAHGRRRIEQVLRTRGPRWP